MLILIHRVASPLSPPVVVYIEDNCTKRECYRGMFADAFHALSRTMNFTFKIERAYQWGSFIDGKWNGMVGKLKMNNKEIIRCSHVMKSKLKEIDNILDLIVRYVN